MSYVLRPYQDECVCKIREALDAHRSVLAVLATGLGKTVIFSHLAKGYLDIGRRVLVLAHRDELIRQAAEKLASVTGQAPGIEMGESRIDEGGFLRPPVVVSSVQSMCRPDRARKFHPHEFGLLIIDEAHHAPAASYQVIIAYFKYNPDLRIVGLTATPKRADEAAMGQVFDSVAYEFGIEQAIDDGWLVPIRQRAVVVEGLDFSAVKSIAGDLSAEQLDKILSEEETIHRSVVPLVELASNRQTLVFCSSVNHARLVSAMIDRYRHASSASLDGSTPPDVRRETVQRFATRKLQFLCNCGLFLEGFDAPVTEVVAMLRPTKSLALYTQVLGRGTRPLPGVVDGLGSAAERRAAIAASPKSGMLAIDFVGNSGRHQIITAHDILGGKYGVAVRDYARKTSQEEGEVRPIEDALERAKDEIDLLVEERERRRRAEIKARAEYHAREVSPFGTDTAPSMEAGSIPAEPITPGQRWYLVSRLGFPADKADRLSKKQAGAIIGRSKREHR